LAETVETMITRQAATLLTLLSLWSPALAADLIGQASIVDGDTPEKTRIHLWGIDAPECNSYGDIRHS
jgi:hypothetical protein